MANIYEALQSASEEKSAPTTEFQQKPLEAPPSSSFIKIKDASATPRIHAESELVRLALNIAGLLRNPVKNVIQFIGSQKGEGTSTLVREFALFAAQHCDKPVLMVEADLIQPTQYQAFGLEATFSLEQVLKNGTSLEGVISPIKNSNLFLATLSSTLQSALTARTFFNPTDVWKMVREQFSLILIDSSPVNVTADSLALCETVDGIVLVVEAEKTRQVVVKKVRDQILMQKGNLLGIAFTKRQLYIPDRLYRFL